MENTYLAFIDLIGKTIDNKNIYKFFFTQAPDVVWGENWNIVPCSIIPHLSIDTQTVSLIAELITKREFLLAKNNSCFSMQDCIDGIISLLFTNPHDKELILNFGLSYDNTVSILNENGLSLENIHDITEEKTNEIIDATINALGELNDETDLH